MTTRIICDYPACWKVAIWTVELRHVAPFPWPADAPLGRVLRMDGRTSMDVCDEHLRKVSFDEDEIAEFERTKEAV